MTADLAAPIRTAIINDSNLSPLIATHLSAPCVFTRRPAPSAAPYPMVMISPDIIVGDEDALVEQRIVITRDISVYGENSAATKYRTVEDIAYAIRTLFHRNKWALTVSGYSVIDIVASGPSSAPTDDDKTIGRVVTLTIRIQPSG